MDSFCHHCGTNLELSSSSDVGFRDECPKCRSDIHICTNCQFYDRAAYNECREPQAERVVDKERANLCEFFKFRSGKPGGHTKKTGEGDYFKKLDDLFKK